MRLGVFAREELRPGIINLLLAGMMAFYLGGCNIAIPPSGESPMSAARNFIPRSEPNLPLDPAKPRPDYDLAPKYPGEPLVVLAISGGGSRSAYYAATVMEEMARTPVGKHGASLLDSVRVFSTVSAGSLAAMWFVNHYDERHQPDFFARFKEAMSANLQWRTYGHIAIFPPLALQLAASNVTRTDLLASEIDKILGGKQTTFDDLRILETRPIDPAPIMMINGTVYNSGQRLAMTNIPAYRLPSLLGKDDLIAVSDRDRATITGLVQPLTFEDIGSDIGTFRVANAIAASAAYPVVLAPVRLRVYPGSVAPEMAHRAGELLNSESIYVADGGMYENEGMDTLLSLVKSLPPKQPVLMIVIDASQRLRTTVSARGKIWDPITVISRMYDIGTMRPLAFYGSIARDYHDPKYMEAVVVRMEGHTPEMDEKLRDIPTMFKLGSKHRVPLETAASANFASMRDTVLRAYADLSHTKRR